MCVGCVTIGARCSLSATGPTLTVTFVPGELGCGQKVFRLMSITSEPRPAARSKYAYAASAVVASPFAPDTQPSLATPYVAWRSLQGCVTRTSVRPGCDATTLPTMSTALVSRT